MSHYVGQPVHVLHETPERRVVHEHEHFTITETHRATITVEFPGGMIRTLPADHFTPWVEPARTPRPAGRPQVKVEPGGPEIRIHVEWSATATLPLNEIIAHYPDEWANELHRAGGDVHEALVQFAEEWFDPSSIDPDYYDIDVRLPASDAIDQWHHRIDRQLAHMGLAGSGPASDPYLHGGLT